MPTNIYFSQKVTSEQNLYEDLVIESLRIYGQDVYYLPRNIISRDLVLNEDIESQFDDAYIIEMYIENTEGFEGEGNLLSKFGLEIRDEATFIVAKRTWQRLVNNSAGIDRVTGERPNEGDLIYLPLSNSFFEISFVEHEQPFYQLSNIPTYKLQARLFEFNDEDFNTGIGAIDAINAEAYTNKLILSNISGIFVFGETVTQINADYAISGKVVAYDSTSVTLSDIVSDDGQYHTFINGIGITAESGAAGMVIAINEEEEFAVQNNIFQAEGETIVDFSENNPFGEI